MWKPEHRRAADRHGLRYPSDLSDREWALIEPAIPPAKRGGRRREVDVREVLNAIFYVLSTGCQWQALPKVWDEYIERHPDGYRYSRFCELYRGWASRISVTMRQIHAGGDKLFVDYAGDTVPGIIDRLTGKTRPARIFVAARGASNFA